MLTNEFGLWSERGVALMYDIIIQNGTIGNGDVKAAILEDFSQMPKANREETQVAKMRIIANRRASATNPIFAEDVRNRKLVIANGVGIFHGIVYDLAKQYGIRLHQFEKDQ